FTDINPFAYREEINLRYITKAADFGNPDMVILPGTKNTMEDLKWLRQTGLENKILQHAEHEKLIFGICGGYQMLGNMISDPHGIEGSGSIKGLGLLQMQTIFQPEKTRTRVTGMFQSIEGILKELSGVRLEGYEIHMGISNRNEGAKSLTKLDSGDVDGTFSRNVYGTYVHGIFDEEQVVKGIVRALLQGKGYDVSSVESFDLLAYKEEQYNQLADIIRDSMDMEAIYAIIEKGI
ncbi:MAG: cobyric acid synthase CobQ, partial [Lachnospiraceae bacterium]|nr:cobyric acid synthase CobQ [Lachnospiraceae bacterium]